jgi:hypothetical protein
MEALATTTPSTISSWVIGVGTRQWRWGYFPPAPRGLNILRVVWLFVWDCHDCMFSMYESCSARKGVAHKLGYECVTLVHCGPLKKYEERTSFNTTRSSLRVKLRSIDLWTPVMPALPFHYTFMRAGQFITSARSRHGRPRFHIIQSSTQTDPYLLA